MNFAALAVRPSFANTLSAIRCIPPSRSPIWPGLHHHRRQLSSSSSSSSSSSPSDEFSLPRGNQAATHDNRAQPSSSPNDSDSRRISQLFQTMSKATLIGRTGATARIHEFDDIYGAQRATFSVGTHYMSRTGGDAQSLATQWHYVHVYDSTPGFDFIASLPAGSQVYVEGNLRLVRSERNGVPSTYANVTVSKSQGTFRVLRRPYRSEQEQSSESVTPDAPDTNTPF